MDSVTQVVLGGAVAQQTLGSKIGNRAVLYGAILGTIPDLDVFVGRFYNPVDALEIHRGFSHSVVFSLLMAPLLGFLISRIERKADVGWRLATWSAFLCLVTHPMLDAFTTWGTQLFWPLGHRLDFKSIFVIDPLYTLPLLFFLVRAMFLPKTSPRRRKFNAIGLWVSSAYLMLAVLVKLNTVGVFERSLATADIDYKRLIVKPAPLNIVLWNANIETPDGYWLGDYSYFDKSPIEYHFFPRQEHLLGELKDDELIRQLVRICEGWYVITQKDGKLYFNDLRFGLLNNDFRHPEFVFSYEIASRDGVVSVSEVEKTRRDGKEMFRRLLSRVGGR
jgi:inner membrane protein